MPITAAFNIWPVRFNELSLWGGYAPELSTTLGDFVADYRKGLCKK
jgi:hypothetical protein